MRRQACFQQAFAVASYDYDCWLANVDRISHSTTNVTFHIEMALGNLAVVEMFPL